MGKLANRDAGKGLRTGEFVDILFIIEYAGRILTFKCIINVLQENDRYESRMTDGSTNDKYESRMTRAMTND